MMTVINTSWPLCYRQFKETRVRIQCKMDDEKLIEIVRQYEFIYNVKHPKYMDAVKKDIAWKEIGKQLKQSAIACKQRWQCLRDAYRRALNKKKEKSEQAGKIKPWKYEQEMSFVAPFFMGRKTKELITPSDDEISENSNENHVTETTIWEKPSTDIEVDDTPTNVDTNSTKILDKFTKDESKQKNPTRLTAVKKKTFKSKPSAFAVLMAKLVDDQRKLGSPRGHDELDRFFLNISDTVKKFSPYVQALAKNKIFSIVSEMELQQFAPHSRTSYAFKSSPQSAGTSAMPTSLDNWNYQTSEIMLTNSDNWNDQTNPSMPKNSESCND